MRNRAHAPPRHQFGEGTRHHVAVDEHIRDAARVAQVVLQNAVGPLLVADEIAADDVGVGAVRYVDALRLRAEVIVAQNEVTWDNFVFEDFLIVIDVI